MHPHILFVLDYFTPHRWWSETVFQNVISRLLKRGYTISVLTSRYDDSLPIHETNHKLHIYRTAKTRLGFTLSAWIQGRKILRAHPEISVIHTSTYGGAIPGFLLGRCYHKPTILTVHEIFAKLRYRFKWPIKGRTYRLFERIIFRLPFDAYHCVSRYTMNSLRLVYGISDAKLHMIYNGVDTEFRDPNKVEKSERLARRAVHGLEDRFVVLYYGHAGKSKGLEYLIEAMPSAYTQNPKLLFVYNFIASKSTEPMKTKIRWLAQHLQTDQQMFQIYHGMSQEELRTMIASADLAVAPSLAEGFGSVHTEVCAMHQPLLTTTIGPIPEVVGGTVLMVAPASATALAEGILHFSNSPHHHHTAIPQFSRENTVEELEEVYKIVSSR